jgi:16S rRNA (cytosine967-C5)-methyltransferase
LALIWREEDAPYDSFTLVNQAVEAAKRSPHMRGQAAFLNACLRRFLRERAHLLATTDQDAVALWNHPLWWIARLQKEYPTQWQAMLLADNQQAPMVLRVNTRQVSVVQYQKALAEVGLAAHRVGLAGLSLARACSVQQLPGFAKGWVSVQDGAAQLAAPLLLDGWALRPGLKVLDACAAPGGKSAHLLELAQCELTALDVDALRCERVVQTLARLGLTARVCVADAAQVSTWWDGALFDAILLDAPCSASGIVRRHPDVRWLRRAADVAQLAAIQERLLARLWPLVKPGGRLLYVTCSVFKAEGEDQINAFLARHPQAHLRPSAPLLATQGADRPVVDNSPGDYDRFYYALLEKHPV